MAGDWIAWQKGLSRKPEVLAIAKATGRSRREVACTLMEFWAWADDNCADGRLPVADLADLAELIPGTDRAFWQAVYVAGWIDVSRDGPAIPNFERWLGQCAKRRLQKTVRQANWRAPGVTGAAAPPPADAAAPTPVGAPASTGAPTREPNRTGENPTKDSPPNPPAGGGRRKRPAEDLPAIPAPLDAPEFRAAWADWLEHRRQRKPRVTPKSAEMAFAEMAGWGVARAVAAIRHSIAGGYQGIFEPKGPAGRAPTPADDAAREYREAGRRVGRPAELAEVEALFGGEAAGGVAV